ncbi:hypothetical protein GpartN1_g6687.t1 [Galdieria partita]|uniref:Uncharacterized protein n=1 Tax=Galdieria partita TaxID=83374 RepID=A0A9C7Q3U4_9RHOD|nr:hypothetical protein GpartN1_g6687.t1 [Galdieria partita]
MEAETCATTKSTLSTPPCMIANEEKSTFQNTSGSTSTNDAFNFEVSDSLREGIFNFLLENSPIEAANFEYRTNPNFLQLLDEVNDNCRKLMLEKFKFINLSLPMTRSSVLRDHLESDITKYPPTLFEFVAICSLETDIVELGEVIEQLPSSNTSNILFLQVDNTESCSILEFLSFLFQKGHGFSSIFQFLSFLFQKGHGSSFLYIDLDMFDLSKAWSTLVNSFRCISTLKSLAITCKRISNAQLLRLLKILKKSLQSCYALLDAQWTEPHFSDILDFLQRRRISLKASFDYLSLQISPTSDVPFEPLWMTDETSLYLDNGKIDSNGLKYLSEALKENHTLTELNIGANNITSEGAKYLSEALKANDTLTRLDIGGNTFSGNTITSEGAKYLSEALKENDTLTRLNLHNNNITSEVVQYLSEALKENHTLAKLDISRNNITSEGAKCLSEALKENQTLTELYIDVNNITSEGAKYLSEALKENDTLTRLDIGGNNITSEGAQYLSEALKENDTLTRLDIGGNTFSGNTITSEGAQYLSEALKENDTLTELNIAWNTITSEGAKYLSEALKENDTLTRLDIDNNNITSEGAQYLSEALKENHTLTRLGINNNTITSEGAKYLSEALKENDTLTKLYIDVNNITSEGAKYLSEALKENQSLTVLGIGSNNITSEGAQYLSEALKENHTLTRLDIGANNITSEGAKYLSEALKENHTLTKLIIHSNNITSEGKIFSSQINQYLERNQSELNTEKSNASNINKSLDQSTLRTNTTTQHLLPSSKYASCLNQSYLQYKSTVLKEMNLLFILFMQHRRLEQLESNSHISIYPPFEMMTSFITNTSNSVDIRKQPKYFETEDYVCSICCSICTDPCCSENCSHVFCKVCIEAWTESICPRGPRCPTCGTLCTGWIVSPFAEKVILKLRLQCPHSCGWQGALKDYERNHKGRCPNEMGECSSCRLELKRSEFFDSHYGNCSYHLVCCDYCHCAIPSMMLCAHKAHECAFAPVVCDACHSFFPTWHSWKVHIEKDCDKVFEYCDYYEFGCQVYLERGDLKKHETESIGYHLDLLKELLRKTRTGVKF